MQPSNSGTLRGRLAGSAIIAVVLAVLAGTTSWVWHRAHDPGVVIYWWAGNAALLFCMYAFVRGRRFLHLPVAAGRVVAIVPAHDEDPEELEACIRSILGQRGCGPIEVHVVDDGSRKRPVAPFSHPRVHWHRKINGGKRDAQCHVLGQLNADEWDYVLTVDGDSVLDLWAVSHLLRAFSRPTVMATTGMVLVRNVGDNLLTRLADVNIGTSCVMMRASRSLLGTLETTSGALAMYRAHILFNHQDRYLEAGTYGDDRCLAMYSALEGEVVGVNEAVVWSAMPTDMRTTYKQRLRWSKSWWCMIPFVLTNMDKFRQMFFPLFGLVQLAVAPITIGFAVYNVALNMWHHTAHWQPIVLYGLVYATARYAQVALYMIERPGMSLGRKVTTLIFLTPLEAVYNLVFLNPTKYIALFQLRDRGWGTHDNAHAGELAPAEKRHPLEYPTVMVPAVTGPAVDLRPVSRRHRPEGAPPPAALAAAIRHRTGGAPALTETRVIRRT